jgi:hypothetical protein
VQSREQDWDERDWDRLVEQIREGDCTPFLGAGACSGVLPMGADLGRSWADHYRYPFANESHLHEVMQYATIVEEDPVTVKRRVTRELTEMGEPDYADPAEPHALLARFPIKVYLTTNYDDFMTRALQRERKQPVTAVCPWYRGAEDDVDTALPAGYEPHHLRPLVYHLHGSFRSSASLVLAEQDYVEFLINLARDLGEDARRVVPVQVLPALTRQPLLFIGYSLRDWSFRMLFHGFVAAVADVQRRRHVSVQLTPDAETSDDDARHRAEAYLTRYLAKLNISVYWGSAKEFCVELGRRLAS